jgi:hypothetical protein
MDFNTGAVTLRILLYYSTHKFFKSHAKSSLHRLTPKSELTCARKPRCLDSSVPLLCPPSHILAGCRLELKWLERTSMSFITPLHGPQQKTQPRCELTENTCLHHSSYGYVTSSRTRKLRALHSNGPCTDHKKKHSSGTVGRVCFGRCLEMDLHVTIFSDYSTKKTCFYL